MSNFINYWNIHVRATCEVRATTKICTICAEYVLSLSIFDHGFTRFLYEFLFFEVIAASEYTTKAFVDIMATSVNHCEPPPKANLYKNGAKMAQNRDRKLIAIGIVQSIFLRIFEAVMTSKVNMRLLED